MQSSRQSSPEKYVSAGTTRTRLSDASAGDHVDYPRLNSHIYSDFRRYRLPLTLLAPAANSPCRKSDPTPAKAACPCRADQQATLRKKSRREPRRGLHPCHQAKDLPNNYLAKEEFLESH